MSTQQLQRDLKAARKRNLSFDNVKAFLVENGLHFDTTDGEASGISLAEYAAVCYKASVLGGGRLNRFVVRIVSTNDKEAWLDSFGVCDAGWAEIQHAWETGNWWVWAQVPPEQRW